jgi:DNA-binding IclR family transcriptional regulator
MNPAQSGSIVVPGDGLGKEESVLRTAIDARRISAKRRVDKNHIGVTTKIFAVLEFLIEKGAKQQSISFIEVHKALPFARTTVYRILYSLEKLHYLERTGLEGAFRLSGKLFELMEPAVYVRKLQSVAGSVMTDLLIRYSETVNLGVLDEGDVAYVHVIESPSTLRTAAMPGDRNPFHSTALGKVLVAHLPAEQIAALLDAHPLIRMTPKTITEKKRFLEHLAAVREQGVAFDLEENVEGVVCVAAPIFSADGKAVAGLSMSGPAARMEAKLEGLRNDVREAGLKVSRRFSPRGVLH